MSSDGSRRFTDREVAMVLKKASEMEGIEGADGGSGLSLRELKQIASEVGISPALIQRAVHDMDAGKAKHFLAGGPRVHQAIRAVDGELGAAAMAKLIQHVEGSSDQVGVVTEALGSTQWTARDRFRTTQVSITPSPGETRVRVIERATSRLWRLTRVAPTMMGAALVAGSIGALDPGSGALAVFTAMGAAAGAVVGQVIWGRLSLASKARVTRLAAGLSREAEAAAPAEEVRAPGRNDQGENPAE